MKANVLAIAITTALATRAQAAPQVLSIAALDDIVAGSESHAASTTDAQQVLLIVADSATAELALRRVVDVADTAQADLRVLNVVNGAHADIATAVNVLSGGHLQGAQRNEVQQSATVTARAAVIDRRGINRTITSTAQATAETHSSYRSFNESVLRTRSRHSSVDTYNAQVPAYYPLQNLTLTVGTPALPPVTVPSFSFDLTTTDDLGGRYGIRGGLGPFRFDPPQLVLGTVSLSGNDILIRGGYVQLPALDLGSATIDVCFVTCGGVSVDLPTIDGPRIDFDAEYRLANANPFKDVRVNAGGGVAVAGRGHLSVALGRVRVGAELNLDLPDVTTNFSFDVLGYTVNTGNFGVEIPPLSASLDLIDADVGVAYEADFDGVLCLSIVTQSCDGLSHREAHEVTRAEITRTASSTRQSATSEEHSSGTATLTVGARMTAAEANVIAMSDAEAQVDTASVVQLNAQAQRGMSVFNAVNAAGAMVGNALNVGAQRPAVATSALTQNNVLLQFQTRPRR